MTSDVKPGDQESRAMPEIHATRLGDAGTWTVRYIHPVHKTFTGVAGMCEYLGKLSISMTSASATIFRVRLRPRGADLRDGSQRVADAGRVERVHHRHRCECKWVDGAAGPVVGG